MRILIHGHRTIGIGKRWSYFAQQMMGLGHDVRALSSDRHGARALLEATFRDVGIEHIYPPNQVAEAVEKWVPDLVCGEEFSPTEATGREMIGRANAKGILAFVQQHQVNGRAGIYRNHGNWEHAHLFCATVENSILCGSGPVPWNPARIHTFGNWEFDTLFAGLGRLSIPKLHKAIELGNRKLIALFPAGDDAKCWLPLISAKNDDWLIVIHPHPMFRRAVSGKGQRVFLDRASDNVPALRTAFDAGAVICVDHLPANLDGIEIRKITSHELIHGADLILTGSIDILWDAYVLGKKAHVFGNDPSWRRAHPAYCQIVEVSRFFGKNINFAEQVHAAFQEPSGLVQDWNLLKTRYGHIDGLWWQRAHNLAKELINEQQSGCDGGGQDGF